MTFKKGQITNPMGRQREKYFVPGPWNVRYARMKAQAKFRGDEWAFTCDEWYDMWVESGVMEHYGREPHQYCMVRKDPIESWSRKNTIIISRRKHLAKKYYEDMRGQPFREYTDEDSVNGKKRK